MITNSPFRACISTIMQTNENPQDQRAVFGLSVDSSTTPGPRLVRASDFCCCVESGGEVLEILGKQVPVAVESDLNRRMAEVGLDGLGGCALGNQQSSAGVAVRMRVYCP